MSKNYWVIILVAIAVVALAIAFWPFRSHAPENYQTPADGLANKVSVGERGCLDSGGAVTTALCCESAEDFPDNCAIGACGCAPDYSHEVKFCSCEEGKCFNGKKCVDENYVR